MVNRLPVQDAAGLSLHSGVAERWDDTITVASAQADAVTTDGVAR